MSDSISTETIKKTQTSLGKYVKKPPLTEKLLTKPPFRFLHDVIMAVVRQTGFLKGLYSTEELLSDNVKDRETKIAFLQKTIDTIKLATGLPITVRPSKVISGHEPEKTNELLQAIAFALDNKISSEESVMQIKSIIREEKQNGSPAALSAQVPAESKRSSQNKDKKPQKSEPKSKSNESARGTEVKKRQEPSRESDRSSRKVREVSLDKKKSKPIEKTKEMKVKSRQIKTSDSSVTNAKELIDIPPEYIIETKVVETKLDPEIEQTDNLKLLKSDTRNAVKDENKDEVIQGVNDDLDATLEIGARSKLSNQVRSETRNETPNEAHNETQNKVMNESRRDIQNESRKKIRSDVSGETPIDASLGDIKEEIDVRSETRIHSRDRIETRNEMKEENRQESRNDRANKLEKFQSSRISESKLKAKDHVQQSQSQQDMLRNQGSEEEKVSLIISPDLSNPKLVDIEKSSVTPIKSSERSGREVKKLENVDEVKPIDNEETDENLVKGYELSKSKDELKVKGKSSRPRTSLRPPSVRPTSARPGAPRIRDKNIDIVIEPDEMLQLGKVNVTLESFNNEDDDELVIIETNEASDKVHEKITLENEEKYKQGHLVNQILETQKELGVNSSSDMSKIEIEWDPGTRRDKEKSLKDMDMLRSSIQTLARSANPLGKLMDFLQEDVDAMQRELTMWRDNNIQTAEELREEYRLTEDMIHPLQQQLQQLENSIRDQTELINSTRANVLRYEDKIHKLLTEF